MKTDTKQQIRFIGFLFIAGTIGLLLLMHVTSARQQRCERERTDLSLIKLI
jgi:hypothetical protein